MVLSTIASIIQIFNNKLCLIFFMKYFNLKVGSPDVNGVALKVDPSAGVDDRISDLHGLYSFKPSGESLYDCRFAQRDEFLCRIELDPHGMSRIVYGRGILFLDEITRERADSMVFDAALWRMQQHWAGASPRRPSIE